MRNKPTQHGRIAVVPEVKRNTCRNCGKKFPGRTMIDGKEVNLYCRKYCLTCSPYKKNNRKRLEGYPILFHCKRCGEPCGSKRRVTHTQDLCKRCATVTSRNTKKEVLVAELGGKCTICGYCKCIHALTFHHVDPETKSFSIANQALSKIDKLRVEAAKCVLLCSNCHHELHAGMAILPDSTAPE
jgi:hypothetical protein